MRLVPASVAAGLGVAALLTQVLVSAPAGAQFPGANGRIAFDRGVSGQLSIVSMRADGSDLRQLVGKAFHPRYNASGTRIVYVSTSGGIRVMNSDGTNKRTVTTDADDQAPTWSPGGGQIAFVRGATLMAVRPDGTGSHTIKSFNTGTNAPSWAPGGRLIAFDHFVSGDGSFHIFTIKPDGSGLKVVPHTKACTRPDWSPNGKRLTFTCQTASSVSDIYVCRPDGTGKARVTKTDSVREFAPTWSPNGARLLYWIIEKGALFTIKPDGTSRLKVRSVVAQAVTSSWQPR